MTGKSPINMIQNGGFNWNDVTRWGNFQQATFMVIDLLDYPCWLFGALFWLVFGPEASVHLKGGGSKLADATSQRPIAAPEKWPPLRSLKWRYYSIEVHAFWGTWPYTLHRPENHHSTTIQPPFNHY